MIKKSVLIIFFSTLFLWSCKDDKDIIPQKKMTQVLLELHLAEALAQHLPKDSLEHEIKNSDTLALFSKKIFSKNNVTEKAFLKSMDYYKSKPEMLDSMYQNILSEIAIMHSKKVE